MSDNRFSQSEKLAELGFEGRLVRTGSSDDAGLIQGNLRELGSDGPFKTIQIEKVGPYYQVKRDGKVLGDGLTGKQFYDTYFPIAIDEDIEYARLERAADELESFPPGESTDPETFTEKFLQSRHKKVL